MNFKKKKQQIAEKRINKLFTDTIVSIKSDYNLAEIQA